LPGTCCFHGVPSQIARLQAFPRSMNFHFRVPATEKPPHKPPKLGVWSRDLPSLREDLKAGDLFWVSSGANVLCIFAIDPFLPPQAPAHWLFPTLGTSDLLKKKQCSIFTFTAFFVTWRPRTQRFSFFSLGDFDPPFESPFGLKLVCPPQPSGSKLNPCSVIVPRFLNPLFCFSVVLGGFPIPRTHGPLSPIRSSPHQWDFICSRLLAGL